MKKPFKKLRSQKLSSIRLLFLIIGIFCSLQIVHAGGNNNVLQEDQRVVTGVVSDAVSGDFLPGVSIMIKGTSTGTITDPSGNYSMTVTEGDILVFSFIGYLEEEIQVGSQTEINMSLSPDIIGLDEVVVIGYGVQKKKLVTGATTQVKAEDLTQTKVSRVEASLQGLTPGMTIVKRSGQPGSDYNITIRGLGSINGSDPLILIDGVPGSLDMVNPNDVESVDILKDAASAAIYGSRAADGVILITTKKGREGKGIVEYDFYYGVSNPTEQVSMLNAQEYMTIMNEANASNGRDPFFTEEEIANSGPGTNWQEEATNKNAPQQSHYLSFTGGNEKSNYSISLSYNNEEGIFDYDKKSYFERFGVRINSQHKVKEFITIGQNLTFTHRNQRGLGTGNQYSNFMRSLLEASPLIPAYDENVYDGFGRTDFQDAQSNPIAEMHYKYNGKNKYDDLIGNMYAEVEIVKGLKLRSDFGAKLYIDQYTNAEDTFWITDYDERTIARYEQNLHREIGYNWDNTLAFERDFGSHNAMVMVGANVQDNWYFNVDGRRDGFLVTDAPVLDNVFPRDSTLFPEGDYGKGDSRLSFFGRLSYNYKEKYLFSGSLRRDGSSRFGKENRFGWFPAISLGWTVSEESFMESVGFLNYFKIRGSWGANGKEPYSRYQYVATVSADNRLYPFGTTGLGISPDILANPNLKWESSQQLNIGFDSRLFNNFRFTFDWFKKTSEDWILQAEMPGITGLEGISDTDPFINAGNVVNKGVELELGYNNTFGDFIVNVNGNFSYLKNEVIEVPGGVINPTLISSLYNGSEVFYRVQEGYPIGYFWGYQTDGIFQTEEEVDAHIGSNGDILQRSAVPGDVRRVNSNGDSLLNDEDKVMLGNPHPDYIYGININLAYKGLDFAINIMGQGGHQIVQAYRAEERFYGNYTTEILNRWTEPGSSDRIPRITRGNEGNRNWRAFSDLYVHDADFLRIKNISLGYNFMQLFPNVPLEQIRIYVAATNLVTFTKYKGLDPEVGAGSSYDENGVLRDAYASGVDIGFYPSARTYIVGLDVTF